MLGTGGSWVLILRKKLTEKITNKSQFTVLVTHHFTVQEDCQKMKVSQPGRFNLNWQNYWQSAKHAKTVFWHNPGLKEPSEPFLILDSQEKGINFCVRSIPLRGNSTSQVNGKVTSFFRKLTSKSILQAWINSNQFLSTNILQTSQLKSKKNKKQKNWCSRLIKLITNLYDLIDGN